MTSVRRALGLSFAERYVLIAIALLGNVLIARLLTPEEIGIYSISIAVVGIAQVVRDFGIGNYLIQVKDLAVEHIRTAFGFSLVIGISLFMIVTLAAPYVGGFYGEERLVQTMRLSALNFLVLPFCSISLSLLRRDMLFSRLVTVNLIAAVFGFATTISLAYQGFGPNSMAIGAVAGNVTTGIGAWIARTDHKLLLPGFSEWRTVLSFGGNSTAVAVITSISMDANDLVVGKILGLAPVAILSRAQGIMNLFHRDLMSAIKGVAFPVFAQTHRDGHSVESRHTASVTAITAVAWSFYGFVSLYSLEALRLLFGPQWDSASDLVPVFCLAGAVASINSLVPTLLISVGRIGLAARADLILQPLRFLFIAIAAIVFKSLFACAIAYLIITVIATPVFYAIKSLCVPTIMRPLLSNLTKSALVTCTTLLIPMIFALHAGLDRTEPLPTLTFVLIGLLTVPIWFISLIVLKHPLSQDPLFLKILGRLHVAMGKLTLRGKV